MGCDVDGGDLLQSLSSACGDGVEASFDDVVLSGKHSTCRRASHRDDEVRVPGGVVLLGEGEDERSIRGGSESDGDLRVCCGEFPNRL
jgi:hypothetical protein